MKHLFRKKTVISLALSLALICTSIQPITAAAATSVSDIVNSMTDEEKVAQTLMVDFRTWEGEDMTSLSDAVAYAIGKYQFGGFTLFAENTQETKDTLQLTKDIQKASISEGGLPLLIGTDQEGGLVYRLRVCTPLPGNMALAATGDNNNAWAAGDIIGSELASVGINATFGPVLDINSNAANPVIGIRSFGDSPQTVIDYSQKMIRGIAENNVVTCGKHFPGHGDFDVDSHVGLPVQEKTLDQLENFELKPFQNAIDMGVDMIMTGHILCPNIDSSTILSTKTGKQEQRPATMSKVLLTDTLKNKMGFKGVVITDAMNMAAITEKFNETQAVVEALAAGADMICMPASGISNASGMQRMDDLIKGVVDAVKSNKLSRTRLNDAVKRIVTLKQKRGILDYRAADYTLQNAEATIRSDSHLNTERKIAAKAVTVVRNTNKTLPLKLTDNSKLLMLTPYANEVAQNAVAFNRAKKGTCMPPGMEVKIYCYNGESEITGDLKDKLDWANTVIVASEISGCSDMAGESWVSKCPQNIVNYCADNGKKSVVMSIQDPYDVQLYPKAGAVVAAYGCKGSSMVADLVLPNGWTRASAACGPNIVAGLEVIFGVYAATGHLPIDIPKFDQTAKAFLHQTLYNKDYGVKYSKKAHNTVKKVITKGSSLRVGKVTYTCKVCHQVVTTEIVNKIKTWRLSPAKYKYTGKVIKPKGFIQDTRGVKLEQGVDFDVIPSKTFKAVGKYKVQIKAKDKYLFRRNLTATIVPATPKISKATKSGRTLKVTMKAKPSAYGGAYFQYQVRKAGSSYWKSRKSSSTKATFSGLSKSSKYYLRVRAYKKVSGSYYYGEWKTVKR